MRDNGYIAKGNKFNSGILVYTKILYKQSTKGKHLLINEHVCINKDKSDLKWPSMTPNTNFLAWMSDF